MRLEALEVRIDADVHEGCHAELITELRGLVSGHPLREHLHGQLMLALYRTAARAKRSRLPAARQVLVEELGTEPGPGSASCTSDPYRRPGSDARAGAVPTPGGPGPVVPRQLPAAVRHFTGREGELAALTGLLDQPERQTPTVVISAIGGTAGVGKTALAVQWAHQVAERFPDGQLYVNLRGYDPREPCPRPMRWPVPARPGRARPGHPGRGRRAAARYRSLLAGRRMLVMLDNAGVAEQVRPLLPGNPGCMAVVTSRDALAGLVARDGARRLDLDVLPLADAVSLLRALIGAGSTPTGRGGALADQCCAAAAGAAGGRRTGRRPPDARSPTGCRAGRPAAAAGPAGCRAETRDRGPGGVLLVLPAPGPRCRPGVPAAGPASRRRTSTPTRPPRWPAPARAGPPGCWTGWPART